MEWGESGHSFPWGLQPKNGKGHQLGFIAQEVQEIYPDLLINQGNIKSSELIGLLKRFEKFIYNNSTAIINLN